MHSLSKIPVPIVVLLFCMSLVCFVAVGPWRALHFYNSGDFASVYGATRIWINGQNPYDMQLVTAEVHRAGDDPAKFTYSNPPPSVYLPTTFPVIAPFSLLQWTTARMVWLCLSLGVFILSMSPLFTTTDLSTRGKWLWATGILFFYPTGIGIAHGNPAVMTCALTMLAVYLAIKQHVGLAALTLGLANCLKPQLSIAAVVLFALWGYWAPLLWSFVLPAAATLVSVLHAPSIKVFGSWLISLQQGLATISSGGNMNDPAPANRASFQMLNAAAIPAIWIHNPAIVTALVWLLAAALVSCYLICRRHMTGDRRPRDMAFFSALTLTVVYHRHYDAQMLLMIVPFLLTLAGQIKPAAIALWLCMLAFSSPVQMVLGHFVKYWMSPATFAWFPLLRHQPVFILTMCLLLIPWGAKAASEKMEWGTAESPRRSQTGDVIQSQPAV